MRNQPHRRGNWLSQLENEIRKPGSRPFTRSVDDWIRLRGAKNLKMLHNIHLDYVSCVLTIVATVLIGRKLWQGWVVAAVNSAVVCVIGVRTAQFGFVPANLLCIALYAGNLFHWRFRPRSNNPDSLVEPQS